MNALGRHILVEFSGCNSDILNDVSAIEASMIEAAQLAGATVINSTFHHFSPWGVSGVVVIHESHFAIHTWPEYQYAAVDLFTCGESVDPWKSFEHLKQILKANYSALEMNRGSLQVIKRSDFKPQNIRAEPSFNLKNGPKIERNIWFTDKDENQGLSLRYTGEVFFDETTPFQRVRVLESLSHGKFLAINNMVMCTERDESHYHEMIVHPVMQAHTQAKSILVIGGGDGGTLRELFKYQNLESVTLVEIDEAVVRASRKHLPTISREFENPKLKLVIGDGVEFIKKAEPEIYDLIILDGSDPVGPAEGLFTHDFYRNCHKALKKDGLIVTQGESPMFHQKTFVELNKCIKSIFGPLNVFTLLFYAPTYPSGMWSLQMGTKGSLDPSKDFDCKRAQEFASDKGLKYYNADIHAAAFALPTFVKSMLGENL